MKTRQMAGNKSSFKVFRQIAMQNRADIKKILTNIDHHNLKQYRGNKKFFELSQRTKYRQKSLF